MREDVLLHSQMPIPGGCQASLGLAASLGDWVGVFGDKGNVSSQKQSLGSEGASRQNGHGRKGPIKCLWG